MTDYGITSKSSNGDQLLFCCLRDSSRVNIDVVMMPHDFAQLESASDKEAQEHLQDSNGNNRYTPGKLAIPPIRQLDVYQDDLTQIDTAGADERRKKRRKLTPLSDHQTTQTAKRNDSHHRQNSSQGTLTWLSKPGADAARETQSVAASGKQEVRSVENEEYTTEIITTPKESRSQPRQDDQTEETDQLTEAQTDIVTGVDGNDDSKKTTYVRRTPKKKRKTLSLHNNGTLRPSPHRPTSSHAQNDSTAIVEKPISKRKMKMKNGKLVPSFFVTLRYRQREDRESFGNQIDQILSQKPKSSTRVKTHPFFTGKIGPKPIVLPANIESDASTRKDDTDQEGEQQPAGKAPIAWSDLKFSKQIMSRSISGIRPIWPPSELQHVGQASYISKEETTDSHQRAGAKMKTKMIETSEEEDVLFAFSRQLADDIHFADDISKPQRMVHSGRDMLQILGSKTQCVDVCRAISNLEANILHGSTPFERGEAAGQQTWTTKYAPANHAQVLQPSCRVLYDWLRGLVVHNVKSGGEPASVKVKNKALRKPKRHRKTTNEMDNFIVDSDSEDPRDEEGVCNAIIISGPLGCGKTASVYAIAKELGFEVFEIHPGMRRSAKDIFDKVGNMTQNHLVSRKNDASRSSSVAPADGQRAVPEEHDHKPSSMASFIGKKEIHSNQESKATTSKKEQKQSLILLEEVDILFEEDKAFWSGVQNLIIQSRRPVIMTCNDASSIPLSELNIHTVLQYEVPNSVTATDYLCHIAAAEGHILDRDAVSTLYASKHGDLRSSITELNFWCQMTVGSKQGGLDWLPASVHGLRHHDEDGKRWRICSHNTFTTGLDLMPQLALGFEQTVRYGQDHLDLPASDWRYSMDSSQVLTAGADRSNLGLLDRLVSIGDAGSALDLVHGTLAPYLVSELISNRELTQPHESREQIKDMFLRIRCPPPEHGQDLVRVFEPLTEEKPTFPPSQGRLAPSLDAHSQAIAVDIAPYARSIVSFDQNMEQHREEVSGSQGKKSRTTRAARAAAEGSDKAYTRSERWFPATLDFDKVLRTGNNWPQWSPSRFDDEVNCET